MLINQISYLGILYRNQRLCHFLHIWQIVYVEDNFTGELKTNDKVVLKMVKLEEHAWNVRMLPFCYRYNLAYGSLSLY